MPDLLKMKDLIETLEKTNSTLETLADKIDTSITRMTDSLDRTQANIDEMTKSVKLLADRTAASIDRVSDGFEKLIQVIAILSKDFKNPLDPKSLVTTAKELRDSLVPDFLKKQ